MGRHAVIEDVSGESAQIDLDAPEERGERVVDEAFIVLEGDFARVLVDFDDIGVVRVAVDAGCTEHVDAENRWKVLEEAAVDLEGILVLMAVGKAIAGRLDVARIASGEEQFPCAG